MSKVILFQGDSITDAGRSREDDLGMGWGYPMLVKGELGLAKPNDYTYYNRGVSGNRIVDVYARIKADIINLKPDYMSLLIGVNDVWHEFGHHNGVDTEKYERIYCMLLDEIFEALPDIKIMILEPFVLEASATTSTEEDPERWNTFNREVRARAAAAKRVAEKYNLKFIPLQDKFDEAAKNREAAFYLADGVHPSPVGHTLIKNEWIKAFSEIEK